MGKIFYKKICSAFILLLILFGLNAAVVYKTPVAPSPDEEVVGGSVWFDTPMDSILRTEDGETSPSIQEDVSTTQLITELRHKALNGHAESSLQLGLLYYLGKRTQRNYAEAYRFFELGSRQGDIRATMAMAYCAMNGFGTPRSPAKARTYLERAEEAGYARALYLFSLLEKDQLARGAQRSATDYLQAAAAMRDAPATNALANDYLTKGQIDNARLWYEKAKSLGSSVAGRNLERLNKVETVRDQFKTSINELIQESKNGDARATYVLATRYHKGVGVAVNLGQSLRFYRLAVRQGSSEAMQMLALITSRSSPNGEIDEKWMMSLANTIQTPASGVESYSMLVPTLEEDDPLDKLAQQRPTARVRLKAKE